MIVKVARSCVVGAPIAEVWHLLRDFNGHADWHPAVAASRIEGGEPADLVGAVRAFRLADGGFLREQLIALSDRDFSLTYCLLEAPVPLDGYLATMRLRPVTDRDAAFLTWTSSFSAPPREQDALARLVGTTIYEAGMAALQARFAGRPAAPTVSGRPAGVMAPVPLRTPSPGDIEADAIVVERHGGPEVLMSGRVRVPMPAAGEVRLRHRAIGVNMVDVHARTGAFGLGPLPAVPGLEAAGEVLDVGRGVTVLAPGDRIVYAGPAPGAYAECRTLPASALERLPDDIADDVAAAAFLKGLMADALLHDVHPLRAGETVLVHAAAGGLGLILCAWARHLGARVIGVVSTAAKAEAAAAAGCEAVVVAGREDVAASVRGLTAGRGAEAVFDGVGQATFDVSVAALARRGHLVSYGQASGPVGARSIDALAAASIRLSRPNLGHFIDDPEERRARAERLFTVLRGGAVRPVIDRRFPLAEAAAAHRRLESRETIGSLVLMP